MKKIILALLCVALPAWAGDVVGEGGNYGVIEPSGTGGVATADLDLDGTYKLILDADGNSDIRATTEDTFELRIGGTLRFTGTTTSFTSTLPFLLPAGTAGAPSWAWSADADGSGTGGFRSAANEIAWATNGTQRLTLSTTLLTSTLPVVVPNGTSAAPSITGTTNTTTGISFGTSAGDRTIYFNTNGLNRMYVFDSQILQTVQVTVRSGINNDTGDVQVNDNLDVTGHLRQVRVISATPTEPYTCNSTNVGRQPVYVDDTNDILGSGWCFCGTIADDTTYDWLLSSSVPSSVVACPFF
jgi:hypothetical protein